MLSFAEKHTHGNVLALTRLSILWWVRVMRSRISETGQPDGLCLPSGEGASGCLGRSHPGPSRGWAEGTSYRHQLVPIVNWGPASPIMRRFFGPLPAVQGFPGPWSWLWGALCPRVGSTGERGQCPSLAMACLYGSIYNSCPVAG